MLFRKAKCMKKMSAKSYPRCGKSVAKKPCRGLGQQRGAGRGAASLEQGLCSASVLLSSARPLLCQGKLLTQTPGSARSSLPVTRGAGRGIQERQAAFAVRRMCWQPTDRPECQHFPNSPGFSPGPGKGRRGSWKWSHQEIKGHQPLSSRPKVPGPCRPAQPI